VPGDANASITIDDLDEVEARPVLHAENAVVREESGRDRLRAHSLDTFDRETLLQEATRQFIRALGQGVFGSCELPL
jgi:hypothetical protein